MPIDQFSAFVKLLPSIEQALKAQGASLPRPEYSGDADRPDNAGDEDTASISKQNIEATSDEESEA